MYASHAKELLFRGILCGNFSDDPAAPHYNNSVGQADDLRQLRGYQDHCQALFGKKPRRV